MGALPTSTGIFCVLDGELSDFKNYCVFFWSTVETFLPAEKLIAWASGDPLCEFLSLGLGIEKVQAIRTFKLRCAR